MTNISVAHDSLRTIVERIENLEEEKKAIIDDIKEIYGEAKAKGLNTKILRTIVRMRKQKVSDREEEEAILDLYMRALNMSPFPEFVSKDES
ncbi:DUF2312 domain-containing protein [Candidatus Endowatersipora endosymbiont of Watersipora subatra]|uniref:DUF2312 domain-containing protein n=1 Tax=Candidatus Endowatersipora endosymbiont of Watersipora subatra TaxID=3077946 RepID=UPI00312C9593